MSAILPDQTTIGAVHLTIPSLERSLRFYREKLGFHLIGQDGSRARLGVGEAVLLVLYENPAARRARGVTGLYHLAVRLPSRLDLARLLVHLSEAETPLEGFGDHGVSESLYLPDVDGNGIELYADRPRQDWPYDRQGRLHMGTEPVDLDDLLSELGEQTPAWDGLPAETRIGHVHLQVADLKKAEYFYTQVVGFELVQRLRPGAAFFSAGGYHHYVATNTWAGAGAPPPPADSIGLRWYEICLPAAAALEQARLRIETAGYPFEERDEGLFMHDPSQNGVLLAAEA